jgi:hypothetical protein
MITADDRIVRMLIKLCVLWSHNEKMTLGELIHTLRPTWRFDSDLEQVSDADMERSMDQWMSNIDHVRPPKSVD